MADTIEDRLAALRTTAPAGSPMAPAPAGASTPVERAPPAPAAPTLDFTAFKPAPKFDMSGFRPLPQNADIPRSPTWSTDPQPNRDQNIRESTRMSQRDLAAARAAEPELLGAVNEANRRRLELINDIERGDADITYWQDVAARLAPQFTFPLTPENAREWTVSELATVDNYLANARRNLVENRLTRTELMRAIVEGQPRPTTTTTAIRTAINNLISMPGEVLRGIGIAGDAVEYWLSGNTDENLLVQSMDTLGRIIDRGLPGDPLSQSFVVDLAGGAGSMLGFMLGGIAGKAIAGIGGARAATAITGGAVGGNQQYDMAAQADADAAARYMSWLAGFGVGTTELIPLDRFLGRVETMSGGAVSRRLRSAAIGAGEEGLQEFFQGISGDVIQRALVDPEHPINWQSAQGQALIGAILGAGMGGIFVPGPDGREITAEELARVIGGIDAAITPPAAPAASPGTPAPAPAAAPPGAPSPPAGGPNPVGQPVVSPAPAPGDGGGPAAPGAAPAPAAVPPVAPPAAAAAPVDPAGLPVAGDVLLAGGPRTAAAPPTAVEVGTLVAAGYEVADVVDMDPSERAEAVQQAVDQGVPQTTATPEQMASIAASVSNIETAVAPPGAPAPQAAAPAPIQTPEAPKLDMSGFQRIPPEEAPSAVQPSPPAAQSGAGAPADAGRVPVGGDLPGVAQAPAGVGGSADGAAVSPRADAPRLRPAPARGTDGRVTDLLTFIAMNGGIRPTPELRTINADTAFVPGRGRFVGPRGLDVDRMRELVAEAGYFGGDTAAAIARTTPADLYDLIDRALRGNMVAPDTAEDQRAVALKGSAARAAAYADRIETELLAWMQEAGIDDPAWLKRATAVAIESGVDPEIDDATFAAILERSAVLLAPDQSRKVIADEIPYDATDAAVAGPLPAGFDTPAGTRPGDAAPGSREGIGVRGPDDGQAPSAGGAVSGAAGQGTDRPAAVDATAAGAQLVIPGAERIPDAELAQNLADKPLRPSAPQQPADEGLFGDGMNQTDLVDMAKRPVKERIPLPDLIAESKPVGANAAGEPLYENSRGRFRVRHDRADREPEGYPDFGGDLAPVEGTASGADVERFKALVAEYERHAPGSMTYAQLKDAVAPMMGEREQFGVSIPKALKTVRNAEYEVWQTPVGWSPGFNYGDTIGGGGSAAGPNGRMLPTREEALRSAGQRVLDFFIGTATRGDDGVTKDSHRADARVMADLIVRHFEKAHGISLDASKLPSAAQGGRTPRKEDVATAGQAPEVKQPPERERPAIFYPTDEETPLVQRLLGEGFKTIVAARTFARQNDERAKEAKDDKALDEIIEAAVVSAARRIVREGGDQKAIYDRLVTLYNSQPKLTVRTSQSMADQAYSTPVPLAYIASRLAGVADATNVYEPTAGNGALLIEDLGMRAFTNEINEGRRTNLRNLGYNTTQQDATEGGTTEYAVRHSRAPKVRKLEGDASRVPFDVVIANPPFGSVREGGQSKEWTVVGNYRTAQIDHAIALNALQALKDDGKAVLILGGVNPKDDRQEGYRAQSKRKFYARLYGDYNVVDHFTVAGPLYARQGAGWPVDVVVIEGRGKSKRDLPAADVPKVYSSWDELAAKLPGKAPAAQAKPAAVAGEPGRKPIGTSVNGKELFEDDKGVRFYVDGGIRVSEPVGIIPGGGISLKRPPASDNFRLASEAETTAPAVNSVPAASIAKPAAADDAAARAAGLKRLSALTLLDRKPFDEIEQTVAREIDATETGGRNTMFSGKNTTADERVRMHTAARKAFLIAMSDRTLAPRVVGEKIREAVGLRPLNISGLADQAAKPPPAAAKPADDFDRMFDTALDEAFGAAEPKPAIPERPLVAGENAATRESEQRWWGSLTDEQRAAAIAAGGLRGQVSPQQTDWAKIDRDRRGQILVGADTLAAKPAAPTPAPAAGPLAEVANFFNDPANFGLGMGVGFDPNIYAKVKPLFVKAAEAMGGAAMSAADLVKRMVTELRDAYRMTRDAVERLRVYVRQFLDDLTSGAIKLGEAPAAAAPTQQPASPPPVRDAGSRKANDAGQVPYVPYSATGPRLGTLQPANLRQGTEEALADLKARVGGWLDRFVAEEIGYQMDNEGMFFVDKEGEKQRPFSAEQIDALALAIDNAKKGEALVLGDQTGIGKGRVVAGMLRWAKKNGMTPVFFTEKPDLYGDMYRDLTDIGLPSVDFYMTNTGENIPVNDAALSWVVDRDEAKANGEPRPKVPKDAVFFNGGSPKKNMERRGDVASGKVKPDVVFSTYDQINDDAKGTGAGRRAFFERIAPNSFFVLDEAHNAGGQESSGWKPRVDKKTGKPLPDTRSVWMRRVLKDVKGALYSSATYAKRPDTMTLYLRTGMSKAVEKAAELPNLIAKGGVPLQQIVAGMLGKAGQYIRREKSFEGINYTPEVVEVSDEAYRDFTDALRTIYEFDRTFGRAVRDEHGGEAIRNALDKVGADVLKDKSIDDVAADGTEFNSIMHNLVGQMLFSITSDKVAQKAIEALRAGEKPVIALSSTMESFLDDYVSENGVVIGGDVGITFKDVVRRYLKRTLRITVKFPDDTIVHVQIDPKVLNGEALAAYRQAEETLEAANIADLPVSPIDHIRNRIAKAGYTVAEVTGRESMIDYSGNIPRLAERPAREQGSSGKRVSIKEFNNGKIDALILNKSGSTGVSAHASPKVGKDTRPRRMVIAQADANIDVYMQMLGRVNRTGQVVLPSYTQIVPDVPAAIRPMSVLMKKMASLNANTTGARSGTFSATDVDMMNAYGDAVAVQIMSDAPEWNARMGDPVAWDDKGRPTTKEPLKRVMGRMTLLWPNEQADLIDQLQSTYKALIARLEAAGENALEAKTLDFKAIVKESEVIRAAKGASPFEGEVRIETLWVKSPGRAMSPDELLEAAVAGADVKAENLRGATVAAKLDYLPSLARYAFDQKIDTALKAGAAWAKSDVARLKEGDAKTKAEKKHEAVARRFRQTTSYLLPGARVALRVDEDADPIYGIVTALRRPGKTKNPLALSSWEATIAVPDSQRMLIVPLSQLYPPGIEQGDEPGYTVSAPDYTVGTQQLLDMFTKANAEGREDRIMVTGNILSGFDEARTRGQIVNFTMDDGTERPGILMPRGFTVKQFKAARATKFANGPQVRAFLDAAPQGTDVSSTDGFITIIKSTDRAGPYFVSFAGARAKGGRYYLEKSVRDTVGDRIRKGAGQQSGMNVFASAAELDALITATKDLGATYAAIGESAAEIVKKGLADTGDGTGRTVEIRSAWTVELGPLSKDGNHFDLGPFDAKGMSLGRAAQLYTFEQGRIHGREFGVAFGADGTLWMNGHGTATTIGGTKRFYDALLDERNAVVVHHNHPSGSSLSAPDLAHLGYPGMAAMWAHGHNGRIYYAALTEAGYRALATRMLSPREDGTSRWTAAVEAIMFAEYVAKQQLQSHFGDMIRAGKLPPAEISNDGNHYINVALHRAGILDYSTDFYPSKADIEKRGGEAALDAALARAALAAQKGVFDHVTVTKPAPQIRSYLRDGGRAGVGRHPGSVGAVFGSVGSSAERGGAAGVPDPNGAGRGGAASRRRRFGLFDEGVASRARTIRPERRGEISPLANAMQALIGRLVGPHPKVRFYDQIEDHGNFAGQAEMDAALGQSGQPVLATVGGSYRFNNEVPAESLIELALADPNYDPRDSALHEAWHHIEFSLLTEEEHSLIQRDIASPTSSLVAIVAEDLNMDIAAVRAMPSYEISAIAFSAYVRRKESGASLRGFHIGVRRAFDRLLDLFRAIARTLGRRGITKPEQVFETARVGRMAGRAAGNNLERVEDNETAFRTLSEEAGPFANSVPSRPPQSYWQNRSESLLGRARRVFTRDTVDAIRVKAQDSFLRWKRIEQAIEADTGAALGPGLKAYVTQSLFSGRAGERLDDLRRKHLEPLVEEMRKQSVDPRSLGLYLYARHAFERNAAIAAINPGYRDKNGDWQGAVDKTTGEPNGSGMTDREAQAIIDAIGAKLPVYEALADRVYAIRDWSLDVMVRFGLLSRDQADEWTAKYPDYVPLRGWEANDGDSELPRVGRGLDIRGPESFRALGRQSVADNPLAYVIQQAEQAIVRAEKNRVLRTVLNLVRAHPQPDLWRVTKSVPERYVDEETGLVRTRHVPPPGWSQENRDLFHGVKVGGKVIWIEFRGDVGKGLSRALRGVGREQNAIVAGMMRLARIWASLQTSLNPEFLFTNFLRDTPAAVINVTDVEGRPLGTRRKILTDALTFKSIRGIRREMKGKPSGEVGRYYEEFRQAGGKISYIELNDIDRIKGRIDKMFEAGSLRRAIWAVGDWIEGVNTAVENSARLSVYINLRKNNFSKDAAASVARELTVNFNRKGEWGPVLNSLYIFYNASTQGTMRMATAIGKSKKVRRVVYGIVAYGFLSEFLNAFLADDDDEGRNAYDAIQDYEKERNMILMIPGAGGAYIKIPMPYGYNVFYLAGQQLAAVARGERTIGQAIGMTTLAALDAFNPIGTAPTLGQLISPTLYDPIQQITENRTWYGGYIAPTKYDQNKPDSQNHWTDTPQAYVDIANLLNEATGGTVGRAGWVDISPEWIEHFVDFGIGGAGRFIANAYNSIAGLITGEEVPADEIPIARRLLAFPTASSARHAFWEAWDVIDQAHFETNEYRRQNMPEQFQAATETYARELAVWRMFDRTRRAINDIREAITLTERDNALSGDARAARIRALEAQERELIDAAIQAYEGAGQ